jgi:predicted DCC family thiol-disulfide oxidoreductase YuxK
MTRKIIYYDAYCNLCFRFVNMIRKWDIRQVFDYEPIQSLKSEGILPSPDQMKSVLLFDNHIFYSKSDAVLRIARFLRTPVSWLYGFTIVPKFIRDKVYDFVASNRYSWFGKCDSCV